MCNFVTADGSTWMVPPTRDGPRQMPEEVREQFEAPQILRLHDVEPQRREARPEGDGAGGSTAHG